MIRRALVPLVTITLSAFLIGQAGEAWARAGGGGSRGSRSYSSPARPAPSGPASPSSPSRSYGQPAPTPFQQQRPSMFGGLMGGLAGFALGGLLGSMLFGGLGHGLGSGLGFGLFDLLLIGGGIALLIMFLRRRRTASPQPAYAAAGASSSAYGAHDDRGDPPSGGSVGTMEVPAGLSDLERGVAHIRQMDPGFSPEAFSPVARNAFLEVQQGVSQRDVSWLRDRISPEIYATLQAQCDRLRAARQTDHVEQIRIQRAEVTEAWQEGGRDFVTVYITASMLDYTVDDATDRVVEGSKTAPQNVEEFWTFVRSVGSNPWQLSAIQTA
jgi:predicted lipid-binding transport protein (Tim44 family)